MSRAAKETKLEPGMDEVLLSEIRNAGPCAEEYKAFLEDMGVNPNDMGVNPNGKDVKIKFRKILDTESSGITPAERVEWIWSQVRRFQPLIDVLYGDQTMHARIEYVLAGLKAQPKAKKKTKKR